MSGIHYDVSIGFTVGDLGLPKVDQHLARTEGKVNRLASELGKVGQSFANSFTGAVESVASKLATLGQVGMAAAVGAATYGVVGLNKELETTRVSLAAVLNANGLTDSIEGGMQRAAGWVTQMKKDARELPGEFSDLLGIVQSGAGAAFQAGLDDISWEKLASNAMAAGKAISVPLDQAGRELAHLLQGHAGAQNVFGTRLGLTAENYNQKTRPEQIAMLTSAIGKFEPAIKEFGKTFDAQSSTFIDNVKTFAGTATSGLFERVTSTLADVNDWFEKNQTTVKLWGDKVSQMLVDAWDDGRKIVEDWGPRLVTFAERFYDWFMKVWRESEPYVKTISSAVKGFLDNPEAFSKIETLLKLYAAAKMFSFGADVASGASGVMGALGGAGKVASAVGGVVGGGGVTTAVEAAGAALGSTGLVAGVVAATVAVLGAAGYEVYSAQQRSMTYDAKGGGAYGYSEGAQKFVDKQVAAAIAAGSKGESQYRATMRDSMDPNMREWAMQLADDRVQAFAQTVLETSDAMAQLQSLISGLAKSGDFEAINRINEGINDRMNREAMGAQNTDLTSDWSRRNAEVAAITAVAALDANDKHAKEREKQKKAAAGQNVTNIGTVTITVASNQAPGQIARDVGKEFTQMKRYPKSSPNVFNASIGR
jgi:hypothetical protein